MYWEKIWKLWMLCSKFFQKSSTTQLPHDLIHLLINNCLTTYSIISFLVLSHSHNPHITLLSCFQIAVAAGGHQGELLVVLFYWWAILEFCICRIWNTNNNNASLYMVYICFLSSEQHSCMLLEPHKHQNNHINAANQQLQFSQLLISWEKYTGYTYCNHRERDLITQQYNILSEIYL